MVRGLIHKLSTMDFPSVDTLATFGYNARMTFIDDIKFVRTRNRTLIEEGTYQKFLFQTVWSFSPDGINTETYVVSAVMSIENERICETFVFPATDENGDDFSGFECWSTHQFLARQDDHRGLLWEYLEKSENLQESLSTT